MARLALLLLVLAPSQTQADDPAPWVDAMRDVHARFDGQPGTLALFGDSITVSLAFWAPLADNPAGLSDERAGDLKLVKEHMRPECWREGRGSEGGMTIRWAHENIDKWLDTLEPEVAVILFGTNDLTQLDADEYESRTRDVVFRCLKRGTVVILTTLPPRHGLEEKAATFAEVARKIAREEQIPFADYHAAILQRRPKDWDGALPQFEDVPGDEYNVPTLIARDGVHPSFPQDARDFSEESLSKNGYNLRSIVTLEAYAEVIREILHSTR